MPRAAATLFLAVATISEAVKLRSSASAYEAFRRQFGVERPEDALSFAERVALYEQRVVQVARHNEQPSRLWDAAVNKFADYAPEEFQRLLGHRSMRRSDARGHTPFVSLFQGSGFDLLANNVETLASSFDWRQHLNNNATMQAKDQGSCGSCWAVASAGALETHAAAKGHTVSVSYEQLVDCVENPDECGGTGGCSGATAELALEYTHLHGLVAASDYTGYESRGEAGACKATAHPVLTSAGFVRLPQNENRPLLEAVSREGPVVVSGDASLWGLYSSGIFDQCEQDAIINHAILLMGYGHDDGLKEDYWLIRNSWGPDWGEHGFIRLLRHSSEEGADQYCGTDNRPLDGVGCKGGPSEMRVCGMCGVLSDSAYPTGVSVASMPLL